MSHPTSSDEAKYLALVNRALCEQIEEIRKLLYRAGYTDTNLASGVARLLRERAHCRRTHTDHLLASQIPRTSPSGKRVFSCPSCGRVSSRRDGCLYRGEEGTTTPTHRTDDDDV